MTICSFFQQGRCKYGDRCRFEHPDRTTSGSSGNRFGALSTGGFGNQGSRQNQPADFNLKTEDIKIDLSVGKGRPEWVFSAYAPLRDLPRQLFGGPQREQSMEEMRLRHYQAAASGNMNQAVQEAQSLYEESVKQMEMALNDLGSAVKYIIDGANEHPNRIDIVSGNTDTNKTQAQVPGQSAFGQKLGDGSSGWGKPAAFGQPSGFSQSSTLNQTSAFGQPSSLNQPSAFGQPSTLAQGTAFGQPSNMGGQGAFGKPAFGQSGFTQVANNQPAFGQTAFGQASAPMAPFGGLNQQNNNPSPFSSQRATSANPSPFGQVATQPATAPSPFGKPSGISAFGQPSQTTSPFGQPQQAQQAKPNTFGQPSAPVSASPFGVPQQPATSFGQPEVPQGVPVNSADAGPPAFMQVNDPNELNPLPRLQGETRRDPISNRLTMWKGQPVKYVNDSPCYLSPQDKKTLIRVNFPDGPPDSATLHNSQGKEEEYTPEITEAYQFFLANGYFKDGIVPAVPPKREWISFDF